jgi:acylphosphatase
VATTTLPAPGGRAIASGSEGADRAGFRVHGRVQGVGFRWWTRDQARRLGLTGTVRNAPDGSVEVQVCGTPDAVREMGRLLQEGPPLARVDGVVPLPAGAHGDAEGFHVVD